MAMFAAVFAMVRVRADEHPPALVVEHHFVEIDPVCAAECAILLECLDLERVVLEIQADHFGMRRNRVDPFFTSGAEQLQRIGHVHFRIVEFRGRRGIHHITTIDLDRIGIGLGDAPVMGNVLVQLHMHQPVFFERMHFPGLGLAWLEEAQRFRDRHLIDQHLSFGQFLLGNAVTRLDDRRILRVGGHRDIGDLLEEGADGDRIGRVIGTLVDDLEHIVRADDRGRHLHAAGTPAIGHRHFARSKRHLVAGYRDRFQDRTADHPFRLFVQIGEIVGGEIGTHSAASFISVSPWRAASISARILRTMASSAWKST